MRFDEVQSFLAVLDHGSFLAAAVALSVSRTTLRRQVEALEARLGTPIFARSTGGVSLTDAGKRLEHGARGLERDYRGLLDTIREEHKEPAGELRFVVLSGPPPQAVTMALSFIQDSWPGVRIHMRLCESPLAVDPAEVDVYVYLGNSSPPGAWRTEIAAPTRQYLVASRSYLESRGTPASLDDLRDHDFLVWHIQGAPESSWLPLEVEWMPKIKIASTSAHVIHELAIAGRGIAYYPMPDPPIDPGGEPLIPVVPALVGRDMSLRVSVASHVARMPKIAVFLDHLSQVAGLALRAKVHASQNVG